MGELDALAAFEEVMADFQELTGIDPNANPKVVQIREALTAGDTPEQEGEYSIRCVICDASVTPEDGGLCDEHKYDEQAHGDALDEEQVVRLLRDSGFFSHERKGAARPAAYEHCKDGICITRPTVSTMHFVELVRRHLTASGVPYVPEELKQLVGWMRDEAITPAQCAVVLDQALASAPAVPDEWQQPAWRPIDTYPQDDGVYRNGTRVWLWHEDLGVCWGFMDDLPSGFRCDLFQERRGVWEVVAAGVKAARKVHYWMPRAPAMPEPPVAAAPTDGRE